MWYWYPFDVGKPTQINILNASFHNYSNEMNIKKLPEEEFVKTFVLFFSFHKISANYNTSEIFFFQCKFQVCRTLFKSFSELSIIGMENRIKSQIFSLLFVLNVFSKFIFNSTSFVLCLVGYFFSPSLHSLMPLLFPNSF